MGGCRAMRRKTINPMYNNLQTVGIKKLQVNVSERILFLASSKPFFFPCHPQTSREVLLR